MANPQYVYTMSHLSKAWPGGKEVLRDISLSFLPGAKIGVLGINGAGKSTLLKIMAGVETEYQGEAWAADGINIGYLPQEPELNTDLTVLENVMLGMGEAKTLVDRFNEISGRFGEEMSDDEMNALIAEQGELQEKIDAADAWDRTWSARPLLPWMRCACRHRNGVSKTCLAGKSGGLRCASSCSMRLTCCCLMSRPTTLMLKVSPGCNGSCMISPARL